MREETLDVITFLINLTDSKRNESYQLPTSIVCCTYQKRVSFHTDTHQWYM